MVSLILTQITCWLCGAVFVRLFTFSRGSLRFRRGMSCLAYIVMACSGAAVINIFRGDLTITADAWPLVGLLAVFAFSVWRAGGNLAVVLRPENSVWTGPDRRRPR